MSFQGKIHPKKLRVDQRSEFYNKIFKDFLGDIVLCSTFSQGKSVVIERFNRTLKSTMWKYFNENGIYRYIDILSELTNKYNNTLHRSIGMTSVDASKDQSVIYLCNFV